MKNTTNDQLMAELEAVTTDELAELASPDPDFLRIKNHDCPLIVIDDIGSYDFGTMDKDKRENVLAEMKEAARNELYPGTAYKLTITDYTSGAENLNCYINDLGDILANDPNRNGLVSHLNTDLLQET